MGQNIGGSPSFDFKQYQEILWNTSIKVCFIKMDTLYIGYHLYKVYPFLWNRCYFKNLSFQKIS